jgi:hypothetical protein
MPDGHARVPPPEAVPLVPASPHVPSPQPAADAAVDRQSEASFPASDPPSSWWGGSGDPAPAP